ncbi:MAG: O-antigen ligase family protein [Deltaproteobacteria bacterium]|nr:O-antigen ligase family protein [Deltaproteobacteria bacterium]
MFYALGFLLINFASYFLAISRGPFWGLFAYMNIYFNSPQEIINWWTLYLPFHRWSLLTSLVLFVSLAIHWGKTSDHKFRNARWVYVFLALSAVVCFTNAFNPKDANQYLYSLLTYSIIVFILIKSITSVDQFRLFCLSAIVFAAGLSVKAYLTGKRVHARLEYGGSADAYGSNEFSLLLAGIIPLMLPFFKSGKPYEKIICILSLPFLLNALVLCNSRGSFIAFAGAIVIATIISFDKEITRYFLVLLMLGLPLLLYLSDEYFIDRLSSLVGADEAIESVEGARELSSGRTEIWSYGIDMAGDNLFGAGPNAFKELARFYMPEEVLTFHPGAKYGVRSAHNTYLQVLVEQGVLGFIVWIAMCLHSYLLIVKSFNRVKRVDLDSQFWKFSLFALNISFASIMIGGLVNSRVYYEFFWWQVALIAVVTSLVSREIEDKVNPVDENDEKRIY